MACIRLESYGFPQIDWSSTTKLKQNVDVLHQCRMNYQTPCDTFFIKVTSHISQNKFQTTIGCIFIDFVSLRSMGDQCRSSLFTNVVYYWKQHQQIYNVYPEGGSGPLPFENKKCMRLIIYILVEMIPKCR